MKKSVDKEDGTPLIEPDKDEYANRALIAQLALATGNPEAAVYHFDLIERCKDHTSYIKYEDNPKADSRPDFPPEISDLIWEPLQKAIPDDGWLAADYAKLFEKLTLTAPIARRYTFASSDAVQVTDSDEDTPSPTPE